MLENTEDATGVKRSVGLEIERFLAIFRDVTDGNALNDRLQPAPVWQGLLQFVLEYLNRAVSAKPLVCVGTNSSRRALPSPRCGTSSSRAW